MAMAIRDLANRVGKGNERNFSYRRPVPKSETKFTAFIRCRKAIFPYWYSETFLAKGY